jgi:hypothetical protein
MRRTWCCAFLVLWASPLQSRAVAPTIELAQAPEVTPDGVHFKVRIGGTASIFDPRLRWRFTGETAFRDELLALTDGVYVADVPAQPAERAIEYAVVAFDKTTLDEGDFPARNAVRTLAAEKSAPQEPSARADHDGLRVELTVISRRPGATQPTVLFGGEELSQGDQLAFGIKANQKAYVYLAERHTSGAFDVLFPNEAVIKTRNPVPANESVRIPGTVWFQVDDQDLGRETVMVLASTSPIKNLEAAFTKAAKGKQTDSAEGALLASVTGEGRCATSRGLSVVGSDLCRVKTRGLILPRPDEGAEKTTVRVAARAKDTLIYAPFEFQHVAKR